MTGIDNQPRLLFLAGGSNAIGFSRTGRPLVLGFRLYRLVFGYMGTEEEDDDDDDSQGAWRVESEMGPEEFYEWRHVAATWRVGGKARLFVDGDLQGEVDCGEVCMLVLDAC